MAAIGTVIRWVVIVILVVFVLSAFFFGVRAIWGHFGGGETQQMYVCEGDSDNPTYGDSDPSTAQIWVSKTPISSTDSELWFKWGLRCTYNSRDEAVTALLANGCSGGCSAVKVMTRNSNGWSWEWERR